MSTLLLLALASISPFVSSARGCGGGSRTGADDDPPAERPAGHEQMLGVLAHIARAASDDNPLVGEYDLRRQRAALESLPPGAPIEQRLSIVFGLSGHLLRLGRVDQSIKVLEASRKLVSLIPASRDFETELEYRLGLSWLRKGEVDNCIGCAGESCLYPLSPEGVHLAQEGSRNAVVHFLGALRLAPPSSPLHLRARWLLNVAHMTLGTHPDGVPEPYRIDPALIAGSADFPAFENVAPALGLDLLQLAGGAIVDDFDGDGIYDVLATTSDPRDALHLLRGSAEGTFEDVTEAAGLAGLYGGGLHVSPCDFDGDGDLDFLVPRGAWLREGGRHPASLLRNDGEAGFVDVTFDAGLGEADYPSQVAAWADYDNDGDLDLFLGAEADAARPYECMLYQNQGDGTFVDVAEQAGVTNGAFTKGAAWGDFDGDRWPDLYVSNLSGRNRLYRNQGDGTFVDVATRLGVAGPVQSFSCWFWDFDNDGHLDLFVASYEEDLAAFVAARMSPSSAAGTPAALYRGDGKGGFEDVAASHGIALPLVAMGAGFGDLDNDGFLDVYLGTGFPSYEGLIPNLLLRNDGGARFENVTGASRMGNLQKGHGISFADVDRDGDVDVYARMGGAFLADGFTSALYRNPGTSNRWASVRLVGARSNRSAVGARVTARFDDAGRRRQVVRWIGQGPSFGNNPLEEHLGLGQATRIAELEVHWPTTDTTQTFRDLPAGTRFEITEGEDEPRVLPLPAIVQAD